MFIYYVNQQYVRLRLISYPRGLLYLTEIIGEDIVEVVEDASRRFLSELGQVTEQSSLSLSQM